MTIELRLISLDDVDWVIPLVRAYHEFEDVHMTPEERVKSVRELVSNTNYGGIWGIYHEEQLVGYLALCSGYSIEFGGQDAFIDELYIKPAYRGLGIGLKALAMIKIEATKMGLKALHLEVDRNNARAKRLYSKSQFVERDKYLLMSCTL